MRELADLLSGISVVTATYNECKSLPVLISAVRRLLVGVKHEIIVVDDSSTDGTLEAAKSADVVIVKRREGQTVALLAGMRMAKFPTVVTMDADLENPPELIQVLAERIVGSDIVVASRVSLPRLSERIACATIGRVCGVIDVFSNFRAYNQSVIKQLRVNCGETFGAEILVRAKFMDLRVSQVFYTPPRRRRNPRIGGTLKANVRIMLAVVKLVMLLLHLSLEETSIYA
jgi:dolichol-phosphate mannosyltransferase